MKKRVPGTQVRAIWLDAAAGVATIGKGTIKTRQAFGDRRFHVEFRTPAPPSGKGQGRGNSGVIFMDL